MIQVHDVSTYYTGIAQNMVVKDENKHFPSISRHAMHIKDYLYCQAYHIGQEHVCHLDLRWMH